MSRDRAGDWRNSIVGFGIVLGAAVGAATGLILAGGEGLALGGAFGAAGGVLLGAIARSYDQNRN